MALSIANAISLGVDTLSDSDSPRLDAEVLLCAAGDFTRTTLIAWPDRELSAKTEKQFRSFLELRRQGHPVAHLLQKREFWSLPLKVTPDTLIPRPDTELLVELSLELLKATKTPSILDLGTGTGAIALALASERPDAKVIATDQSEEALAVAQDNAASLSITNTEFHSGSWCDALPKDSRFDLIVSNPPYIREDDPHLSQGDVRYEPLTALTSGITGLDDLKLIAKCAMPHLKPGGWLVLEHGYDQAESVVELLEKTGYSEVENHRDLGQNPRATIGRKATLETPKTP